MVLPLKDPKHEKMYGTHMAKVETVLNALDKVIAVEQARRVAKKVKDEKEMAAIAANFSDMRIKEPIRLESEKK